MQARLHVARGDPQRGPARISAPRRRHCSSARTHRPPLHGKAAGTALPVGARHRLWLAVTLRNFWYSRPAAPTQHRSRWLASALAALLLLAAGLALGAWLRPAPVETHPMLHRITFRRGTIQSARFTPDGNRSIRLPGRAVELFSAQPNSTESRPLHMPLTGLFAVSNSGELAVSKPQDVRLLLHAKLRPTSTSSTASGRPCLAGPRHATTIVSSL